MTNSNRSYSVKWTDKNRSLCLCWEFYVPVNNEVMSSRSVNSALFLGRLSLSKRLTSAKRGRPRQ